MSTTACRSSARSTNIRAAICRTSARKRSRSTSEPRRPAPVRRRSRASSTRSFAPARIPVRRASPWAPRRPRQYSNLRFEGGGASPNRNFSYYVGAAGYNQNIAYGDRPEFAQYAAPIDVYRNGCGTAHPTAGCYKGPSSGPGSSILGPNGYELGPLFYGYSTYLTDRDNVVNLHFGIPHKHSADGIKDDVQFLYNSVLTETYFASAPSDWGRYYNQIVNGTAGGTSSARYLTISSQNRDRDGTNPPVYNDKQYYLGSDGRSA